MTILALLTLFHHKSLYPSGDYPLLTPHWKQSHRKKKGSFFRRGKTPKWPFPLHTQLMSKQGLPTHFLSQERGTQGDFKKTKTNTNTTTPPPQTTTTKPPTKLLWGSGVLLQNCRRETEIHTFSCSFQTKILKPFHL